MQNQNTRHGYHRFFHRKTSSFETNQFIATNFPLFDQLPEKIHHLPPFGLSFPPIIRLRSITPFLLHSVSQASFGDRISLIPVSPTLLSIGF
jgi:hypothetical protein